MIERNNLWLTVEETLAQSWWTWYKWFTDDPSTRGPEPPLDDWDKKALAKMSDLEFTFKAFKKATITALAPKDKWRMVSLYDVKVTQWVDAGYARHGEAKSGGDLGVAGLWYWAPDDEQCRYEDLAGEYPWKPNQVIQFMPDDDEGQPATEITDVNLIYGQPGRFFPSQPV